MHKVVFKSGFCFDYINLLQLSNCYSLKSIVTNAFENQCLKHYDKVVEKLHSCC